MDGLIDPEDEAACWGGIIKGDCAFCTPGFVGGKNHFKNKFCDACREFGIKIPVSRVKAMPEWMKEEASAKNFTSMGFWKVAPDRMGGGQLRIVNNTMLCDGPWLVICREEPAPLDWDPLPPSWETDGVVSFAVSKGTLVPTSTLTHSTARRMSASSTMRSASTSTSASISRVASTSPPIEPSYGQPTKMCTASCMPQACQTSEVASLTRKRRATTSDLATTGDLPTGKGACWPNVLAHCSGVTTAAAAPTAASCLPVAHATAMPIQMLPSVSHVQAESWPLHTPPESCDGHSSCSSLHSAGSTPHGASPTQHPASPLQSTSSTTANDYDLSMAFIEQARNLHFDASHALASARGCSAVVGQPMGAVGQPLVGARTLVDVGAALALPLASATIPPPRVDMAANMRKLQASLLSANEATVALLTQPGLLTGKMASHVDDLSKRISHDVSQVEVWLAETATQCSSSSEGSGSLSSSRPESASTFSNCTNSVSASRVGSAVSAPGPPCYMRAPSGGPLAARASSAPSVPHESLPVVSGPFCGPFHSPAGPMVSAPSIPTPAAAPGVFLKPHKMANDRTGVPKKSPVHVGVPLASCKQSHATHSLSSLKGGTPAPDTKQSAHMGSTSVPGDMCVDEYINAIMELDVGPDVEATVDSWFAVGTGDAQPGGRGMGTVALGVTPGLCNQPPSSTGAPTSVPPSPPASPNPSLRRESREGEYVELQNAGSGSHVARSEACDQVQPYTPGAVTAMQLCRAW
eukprot:CAMPEP_0115868606 /NCGR_PEP_ID=MMETSP0287-20121206/21381_1 /TAXON_ID=412157 /ORGANISM="Chrysochromulina rotalis, Strain UIO044" /LENGTH=751 /DNA_ID=CAMNT_0003323269 /DNA_START=133 /DNA_END=2385 /DNA_ORIENTATION=-